MKASELRIGNYVMIKNELLPNYKNQPLIVTSIQQRNDRDFPNSKSVISCYVDKHNSVSQFDEFIRPIQLTEEWLLKFGFVKDLENNIYLNVNSNAFLCWQNNRIELLDDENNKCISFCNYVNQLQNLYFALTGEELTIKK